jgi:hypothetical protein
MKSFTATLMALLIITAILFGCGTQQTVCPKIGDKAPDVTLIGIDGKNVK